jgi:hypothetical protein
MLPHCPKTPPGSPQPESSTALKGHGTMAHRPIRNTARRPPQPTQPTHSHSLLPKRGGVGWGVRGRPTQPPVDLRALVRPPAHPAVRGQRPARWCGHPLPPPPHHTTTPRVRCKSNPITHHHNASPRRSRLDKRGGAGATPAHLPATRAPPPRPTPPSLHMPPPPHTQTSQPEAAEATLASSPGPHQHPHDQ